MVFPFPGWVRQSGPVMLVLVVALSLLLLADEKIQAGVAGGLRPAAALPPGHGRRPGARHCWTSSSAGSSPLQRRGHYVIVVGPFPARSGPVTPCRYQLLFHAFGFVARYRLPWSAALVAMVITTISVVVPSSPGYIGTFHFLCQLALGLVPGPEGGPALSYAFVLHAVSVFPVFFLGLFFLARDKISLRSLREEDIHAADH